MIKKTILFMSAVLALSLTGCSGIEDYYSQQMKNKSGILEDSYYKQYKEYADSGSLDGKGYYIDRDVEPEEVHAQVHVTFADNNNLNVSYFSDAEHAVSLDTSDCYLNPGESIHAVVSVKEDVSSNMYEFSGFRVYEFDNQGNRIESDSLKMHESEEEQVLEIPFDFEGTELSIQPIGKYPQRTISLKDYCSDDGNLFNVDGTWIINDKTVTGDTAEISPVTPYIISYEFDNDEYFYVSSTPESFYSNNEDGLVVFDQREADDKTVDYSVELHKYLYFNLVSDTNRKVTINEKDKFDVNANTEIPLPKLKYGDTVSIETNKLWPDLENNRDLVAEGPEPYSNGTYKYKLTVPEKDGEFVFNPSDYNYEHGTVIFKCFGKKVTATQTLAKGHKIYYEQNTAEPGYWLPGGNNYVVVGEKDETIAALQSIHFTHKNNVTVNLPQPSRGGKIIYMLDGKKISSNSVSTYSGSVITMRVDPWEGWKCSFSGERKYYVNNDRNQTASIDMNSIDTIFSEDEGHKPALSLNLEKSVGKDMQFTLKASDYYMDVESYGGGWKITDLIDKDKKTYDIISNTQTIISKKKIGTDQPIVITIKNRAIQSGKAVRIAITKTDTEDNKTKERRYIGDLSKEIAPIHIYRPGTNATSTVWYKSINITIGVVNVKTFTKPSNKENTIVTVKNSAMGTEMVNGDLIEAGTKVKVIISPMTGYYITGKNVSNDVYSSTMPFSEYQKNISSIISKHPAKKYYTLTLDKSDPYAEYSYKLDGNKASGTIKAKEGQKLELTYKITDSAYRISHPDDGIIFRIGPSTSSVTKSITINEDMDGRVITKSNFGIETRKR